MKRFPNPSKPLLSKLSRHWSVRIAKALALSAIVAAMVQPAISFAQSSGVGGDFKTRLLWRNVTGAIALWRLDANLNYETSVDYGPYPGWIPVAITTAADNNTYALWKNVTGQLGLWLLDANLNVIKTAYYGPYPGWTPETLSVGTNASDTSIRVIWKNTNGSVSVWTVNSSLSRKAFHIYGPYPGWDPGPIGSATVTSQPNATSMPVRKSLTNP